MEAIKADLDAISQDDETWWSLALDCIHTHAFRFERTLRQQGSTKLQAVMMQSTSTYLPAEAWEFLRQKGHHTTNPKIGYTILVSLADRDNSNRTGQLILNKLKSTLDDPHADNPRRKQAEVWCLVKQLQNKRKMHSLRNGQGVLLPNPDDMAAKILQFGDSAMSLKGCTAKACSRYLRPLFRRFNVKLMSQMPVRPLTLTLVEAALASLNQTSSPGIDSIPCRVYSKFQSHFSPRMLQITQRTLDEGKLKPEWAEALLNLIPKGRGIAQVANSRPLVLQNTTHTWMAAIVALQIQDLVSALTPVEQKGFIKGRSIFDLSGIALLIGRLS